MVIAIHYSLLEEAAAGVSSIRKLRERQDQRTRFDDLTISNAEPSNQVSQDISNVEKGYTVLMN